MRYVAAYLLASLSGEEPSADTVKTILSSVGIEANEDSLKKVLKELKGKNIDEIVAKGIAKLASVPSGGGAAPAAAGASNDSAGAVKKEEAKKEESEEESDGDMGFGLFD